MIKEITGDNFEEEVIQKPAIRASSEALFVLRKHEVSWNRFFARESYA